MCAIVEKVLGIVKKKSSYWIEKEKNPNFLSFLYSFINYITF